MSTGQKRTLRWVALGVLLAGGFLPPVDFFIVNVALASIHESLGASPADTMFNRATLAEFSV